jgi:hypothetical protein
VGGAETRGIFRRLIFSEFAFVPQFRADAGCYIGYLTLTECESSRKIRTSLTDFFPE